MDTPAPLEPGPIDWAGVARGDVAEGITARSLVGEHLSTSTFDLEPGAVIPRHAHPNEELGLVLRGALRMCCGDEEFTVEAGDTFFVRPNTPHDGVALGEGCTLLECYSPPRTPSPVTEEPT